MESNDREVGFVDPSVVPIVRLREHPQRIWPIARGARAGRGRGAGADKGRGRKGGPAPIAGLPAVMDAPPDEEPLPDEGAVDGDPGDEPMDHELVDLLAAAL